MTFDPLPDSLPSPSLAATHSEAVLARAQAARALVDLRRQLPGPGRMVAAGTLAGVLCGIALSCWLLGDDLSTAVVSLGGAVASLAYCLLVAQRRGELLCEIAVVEFARRKADEALAGMDRR